MKDQAVDLLYTTYPAERLARDRVRQINYCAPYVTSNGTRRSLWLFEDV